MALGLDEGRGRDVYAVLDSLGAEIRAAEALLAGPDGDVDARQARARLTAVEDVLARLAREAPVDGATARRLSALRDELGGRLLASVGLDAIEAAPTVVAGVLRQAAEGAGDGVAGLLDAGLDAGVHAETA